MEFGALLLALNGLLTKLLERREAAGLSEETQQKLDAISDLLHDVSGSIRDDAADVAALEETAHQVSETLEIAMRIDRELLPQVLTQLRVIRASVTARDAIPPEIVVQTDGGGGTREVDGLAQGTYLRVRLTARHDHLHGVVIRPFHGGSFVGPENLVETLQKDTFQSWELLVRHPSPWPLTLRMQYQDSLRRDWVQKWVYEWSRSGPNGGTRTRWVREEPQALAASTT